MWEKGMRSRSSHGVALRGAAVAVLTMLPAVAWGLGLGQIQTDTRIGQAFSAHIPIVGASANDLQGLTVGLASPDEYKTAGLSEPGYLFSLKFSVESGPSGPYVEVSSPQAVRLPFLVLLVHANWSSGEVTRQYTVLLNPPIFAAGTQAAPVATPVSAAPVQRPIARTPAQPSASPPAPVQQVRSYGPVPRGATLWGLAHRLRPSASVSVNQMMMALYRANPGAFVGNINRLKAGYVLRVPSQAQIQRISGTSATQMVAQQNQAWRTWRNSLTGTTPTVVAARPAASAVPTASTAGAAAVAKAGTPAGSAATRVVASGEAAAAASKGRVLLTTPKPASVGLAAAAPGTAATSTRGVASVASTSRTAGAAAAIASGSTAGPVKIKSGLAAIAAAGKRRPAARTSNVGSGTSAENQASESGNGVLMDWATSPKGWIVAGVIILLLVLLVYLLRRKRAGPAVISAADRLRAGEEPASAEFTETTDAEAVAEVEPDRFERETSEPEAEEWHAPEPSSFEPVRVGPEFGARTFDGAAAESGPGAPEDDVDLDLALERPAENAEAGGEPMDFERIVDELSTFIETYVPGGGEVGAEPGLDHATQAPQEDEPPPRAERPPAPAPRIDEVLELSPEEEAAIMGREPEAEPELGAGTEAEPEEGGLPLDGGSEDPVNTKLDLARAYVDLGDPESARGLLEEVIDEGGEGQRDEARRILDSLG